MRFLISINVILYFKIQVFGKCMLTPKKEISNLRDSQLIFLSLLIVIITPFASDSYTPSLPTMTLALSSTAEQMQLTMTTYLIGVSTSQLVYGSLSDRYGRRPIILIGLIIAIIGSILCAAANSLLFILLARLIQGIGAGVCNALFRAIIRDQFSGYKMSQVGSYAGMMFTIAFAGAPVLGGYIQTFFGWRANFIFITLVILTIFIMLWYMLPATHHKRDAKATRLKNIINNYSFLLSSPTFVGYTIISSLAYSGFIAYYTAAPFILENEIGLTPEQFGWLSLGIGFGLFIGMFLNARLVVIKGVSFLLLVGLIVMIISGLIMLIAGMFNILNTFVIIMPVILFALASSFVFTNAMTNAFHPVGHIAGVAGGMYGFIQVLGGSLTSILVVKLHERTQVPLASILTGLSLSALILFYLLSRLASHENLSAKEDASKS
jgi:MFS transporter, DHA1 family, 2-module integral membrane pump EmrD